MERGKHAVAVIVHHRGCFGFRSKHPPKVEVLTDAAAAARVGQDGAPAVIWLDLAACAFFLTERWGCDVVKQQLPVSINVSPLPNPMPTTSQEDVVAKVAFTDRTSLEVFVKLALQVLPDWLSIRQSALGKNLLLSNGHWLLDYHAQALRLRSPDGAVSGLLRLDLHAPCIQLLTTKQQPDKPGRVEVVTSLAEAARMINKQSRVKSPPTRSVQQSILTLKPTHTCVSQMKLKLQATAECQKRAQSMSSWLNGGILAALVDCAASLKGPDSQQDHSNPSLPVLQCLSDSVCCVLDNAGDQSLQQAQLLVACLSRSLNNQSSKQLAVVQLLQLVLNKLADSHSCPSPSLLQVSVDCGLLESLLHCYSASLPQLGTSQSEPAGLLMEAVPGDKIHDLFYRSLPCPLGAVVLATFKPVSADVDSAVLGCCTCCRTSLDVLWIESAAPDTTGSCCLQTEPGSQPRRPAVPRLSLLSLGAATSPAAGRTGRLSSRLSETSAYDSPVSNKAGMASLQLLGYSCGESMMAADLAAFATYKQYHGDLVRKHQHQHHTRSTAQPASVETDGPRLCQQPLPDEQLQCLPIRLQLQLQLLECIQFVVDKLPAGSGLPLPVSSLLLYQLLLPRSILEQEAFQVAERGAVELGLDRQRHLAIKLMVACCNMRWQQLHNRQVSSTDDTKDTGPRPQLHDAASSHIKQRLLDYCTIRRPDDSVHLACREVVLLLRDYLHLSHRPMLVDTVCSIVGRALVQQEHLLRGTRVSTWTKAAMLHMDALVQLYTEMAQQAESPVAAGFLLSMLGCKNVSSTPASSWSGACSSSGGAESCNEAAPADTLQLVLDFLQQFPASSPSSRTSGRSSDTCRTGDDGVQGSAMPSAAGCFVATADGGGVAQAAAHPGASVQASPAASATQAAVVSVPLDQDSTCIKAHCWQLLTAVLQLALRQTQTVTAGDAGASSRRAQVALPNERLTPNVAADHTLLQSPQSTTTCGMALLAQLSSTSSASSSYMSLPAGASSSSSSGGGSSKQHGADTTGSGSLLKILVEVLVRQRGGRALVLQQLEELDGGQAALPLQQQLLGFLSTVLSVPNSHVIAVPGLAEFYVHYHFVQFIRYYYKLPSAGCQTRPAACCKGHVKVLLSLCHHAGGANLVRRRFLQLKVLEFLMRELSLEHSLCSQQHQACSSCCSTPLSTARGTGCITNRQPGSGRSCPSARQPFSSRAAPSPKAAVTPAATCTGISRLACETHDTAEAFVPKVSGDEDKAVGIPLQPRPPELPRPASTRDNTRLLQLQHNQADSPLLLAFMEVAPAQAVDGPAATVGSNAAAGAIVGTAGMKEDTSPQEPTDNQLHTSFAMAASHPLDASDADDDLESQHGRCPQQPALTGDASMDDKLIADWEERTGCDYIYHGLSSDGDSSEENSSGSEADIQTREDRGTSKPSSPATPPAAAAAAGPRVPQLLLRAAGGGGTPVAASASAVPSLGGHLHLASSPGSSAPSSSCARSYRPGLDLEDDFEHGWMADEGADDLTVGSSSSSRKSSLIAAGRHAPHPEEDEQHSLHDAAAASDSNSCHSSEACSVYEDDLSDSAEDDLAGDMLETGLDVHRSLPKPGIVPQLKLPGTGIVPQLKLPGTAIHQPTSMLPLPSDGNNSAASRTSSLSSSIRPAVPNLMAVATPLTTTRLVPCMQHSTVRPAAGIHHKDKSSHEPDDASVAGIQDPGLASYRAHRHSHALYGDAELQMLCLELALHLLATPMGLLDPLQLPHDPTDGSLHHKVLVLMDHLSHQDNARIVTLLASRAHNQAAQEQPRPGCSSNGSASGSSECSSAATPVAALGHCTLRLLRLLSSSMFNAEDLQLGSMIQKGAFSEIYAGTLTRGGRSFPIAVKKLECDGSDQSSFERIYNEIAILESLHGQRGIIPLLDYAVLTGSHSSSSSGGGGVVHDSQPRWLMVFPHYSCSLKEWRRRRGTGLQQQDVVLYLRVFVRIAAIVSHLHASNVVHYDIKGDNLLLDESAGRTDGLPFDIVLADFGDALKWEADGCGFAQRHRGTELFSSPEMLLLHAGRQNPEHEQHDRRRHRGVGRPHDIWSLGCTLFELLTCRLLFEDEGVGRITSVAARSSSGGASRQPQPSSSGGVLSPDERAQLAGCAGLIELVECQLMADPAWRPTAAEVVIKAQRLLDTCSSSSSSSSKA